MCNRTSETSLDTLFMRLSYDGTTIHSQLPRWSAGFLAAGQVRDQETFCVSVQVAVNGESHALPQFGPKLLNDVP